jgi:hypothetical protein
VPFAGDPTKQRETTEIARESQRYADAVADLDRVRVWARESRKLLSEVLAPFGDDVTAIARAHEDNADGNMNAAALRALVVGAMVRGTEHLLELLAALGDAQRLVTEIEGYLPESSTMDGTDWADGVLKTAGYTREERATALSSSVDALKKRRQRRR